MANNEIKVRDLADTSTIATDNQIMVLTDESNNTVKNITVKDFLTNIISSNSNNAINTGSDNKLFTSDLTVDIGDLTSLTTTNKSSLVNAVNEINSNVLVSKGFLENGTAYNNPTIYNNVYQYNHSSFDLSKFTVVGSPVITDDGIASGFSSSDYISLNVSVFNPENKSWIINCGKIKTPNSFSTQETFFSISYDNKGIILTRIETNGTVLFAVNFSDSWGAIGTSTLTLNTNTEYYMRIKYTLSQYILEYSTDSETWVSLVSLDYSTTLLNFNNINIGKYTSNVPYSFQGSIDLKQFSLTVDGYPVFNGNKTGVDTISADYTQAGSTDVTVSSSGIASGFSSTAYLSHTLNFSGSGFKARIPFTVTATNATQQLFYNTNLQLRLLYVSGSTALYPSLYLTDGTYTIQPRTGTYGLQANTNYIVEYEYIKGTSASIKLYAADGVTLLDSTISTTTDVRNIVVPNTNLTSYISASNAPLSGTMDLAGTRVETDAGVYRPFLQIPYTISSTGSKIVDSAYRDRVQDVYREYGKALYYTIDETNKDVTLPMGEIYGFMGKTIQYSYRNGITYYDVYSDNTLEIGGTCTSGTTYNLPRAFKDANYVLTIPYSAKTATSFTPSATGDFIAKGVSA